MGVSDWIALGELIIAIIGIIVGCIGGKELKEANDLKIQIRDLKMDIEKIQISNSQMANTINNNGLGYRDAKELTEDIVNEKTKNMPRIVYSEKEPNDMKNGSVWIQ